MDHEVKLEQISEPAAIEWMLGIGIFSLIVFLIWFANHLTIQAELQCRQNIYTICQQNNQKFSFSPCPQEAKLICTHQKDDQSVKAESVSSSTTGSH